MPNIADRPYVGTWSLNNRQVVRHTPDALVYFNGDTAVPGCKKCNGFIDLQPYIKSVSVDVSTEPGGHSGNIQFSIPRVYGDTLFQDGKAIIRPTLEVHIYMRGYFPVRGMFDHLPDEQTALPQLPPSGPGDKYIPKLQSVKGLPMYPYYHVFHGVVTQVNYEYSDGFYQATAAVASMLHFWQFQIISTNGSLFGSRPRNSQVKMSLRGHNLTGMNPYSIIYMLYKDTGGAAAGVGFALSSKTNVNAVSQITGRSLYSMALLYWERRFKQTMYSLRMHGVNGRLFNGAQQAFLGRTRDVKRLLKGAQHADSTKTNKSVDPFSEVKTAQKILSEQGRIVARAAQQIGLSGAGLDLAYSELAADSKRALGMNVLNAQAYVSDISNWGNVNLFESEYETKLDIANKVREITGYEFYQDVDGDLVFKPPFYNMDTRSNRVYRIEDIDIISINFTEKEPSATFVTNKGSQFKNLAGTGLDNEWGTRGQYIDYRLVAQFGWRAHNQDVSYFSNPRSLFYASVNKLDLLNIDVNSASLTIPIRPELRPGYPVYIPFVDCYYYVTAFSHAFTFGAQCTTSVTLTARRAKFFAPRKLDAFDIDAFDLSNPYNPPTPIQIADNLGLIKFAGFPNVVMALDPNKTNPKYDIVLGDQTELLNNLLEEMKQDFLAIAGEDDDPERERFEGPTEFMIGPDTKVRIEDANLESLTATFDQIEALERRVAQAETELRQLQNKGGKSKRNRRRIRKKAGQVARVTEQLETFANDPSNLINAVMAYQERKLNQNDPESRFELTGVKDAAPTSAYLDFLSDRKANFVSDDVPGYYRYFSASHPRADQQGLEPLPATKPVTGFLDTGEGPDGVILTDSTVEFGLPISGARGSGATVRPTSEIQTIAFSPIRVDIDPTMPAAVDSSEFNFTPNFQYYVFLPLLRDRIFNAVIEQAPFAELKSKTIRETFGVVYDELRNFANSQVIEYTHPTEGVAQTVSTNIPPIDDPDIDLPFGQFGARGFLPKGESDGRGLSTLTVEQSLKLARKRPGEKQAKRKPIFTTLGGQAITENKSGVNFQAQTDELSRSKRKTLLRIAQRYAGFIVNEVSFMILTLNEPFFPDDLLLSDRKDPSVRQRFSIRPDEAGPIRQQLGDILNTLISGGVELRMINTQTQGKPAKSVARKKFRLLSERPVPVFPVSDGLGYEVFGSYRYGRGIDAAPGGLMQRIYEEGTGLVDPFGRADAQTIELFLAAITTAEVQARAQEIFTNITSTKAPAFRGEGENIDRLNQEFAVRIPNENLTQRDIRAANSTAAAQAVLESFQGENATNAQKRALKDLLGFKPGADGGEVVDGVDISEKADQWANQFGNSVATSQDAVFKLPVVNVGYTLRDLGERLQFNQRSICSCRAAEADVLLEAFGFNPFVAFGGVEIDPDEERQRMTIFQQQDILQRSILYREGQAALRGQVTPDATNDLFDAWRKLRSSFEDFPRAVQPQLAGVGQAAGEFSEAFANAVLPGLGDD